MPKTTRPTNLLTDKKCQHAKPGKHFDGGGLYLLVTPEGVRYWRLKYRHLGREKLAGLGRYPEVTLGEARDLRDEKRKLIGKGLDPIAEGRVAEAEAKRKAGNTFKAYATKVHADIASQFRSGKHAAQWKSSLQPVFDKLGDRPIGEITKADLLDVLRPITRDTPETGARVRQRVRAVFRAALRQDLIVLNPTEFLHEEPALKRPKHDKAHFRALAYGDVPAFVEALHDIDGDAPVLGTTRLALEFAILTAARTGEIIGATWDEIDWGEKVWRIPASRMKAHREHVVPLGARALAVLEAASWRSNTYLFPSPFDADAPLSNMSLLALLGRMGWRNRTTVHGLCRSTFSTWARERTNYNTEIIEAALAHRDEDRVAAAYNRAQYAEQRRGLAEAWERFCTTPPGKAEVVSIHKARA
jgi:integrase